MDPKLSAFRANASEGDRLEIDGEGYQIVRASRNSVLTEHADSEERLRVLTEGDERGAGREGWVHFHELKRPVWIVRGGF